MDTQWRGRNIFKYTQLSGDFWDLLPRAWLGLAADRTEAGLKMCRVFLHASLHNQGKTVLKISQGNPQLWKNTEFLRWICVSLNLDVLIVGKKNVIHKTKLDTLFINFPGKVGACEISMPKNTQKHILTVDRGQKWGWLTCPTFLEWLLF